MLLGRREALLTAGIVQLLICCAQCKPQGSTLLLFDADCKDLYSPSYCLNGNNTCSLCTEPSSGCPEGFFNPSGPSSQCFKHYDTPLRTWEEAKIFCNEQNLTLATPNDDVNLEELGQYIENSNNEYRGAWLGARSSASGFLWEAGVGEQPPGSSSGRRGLVESHPGWWPGQPGDRVGNGWCLMMWPGLGSTPYHSYPCSSKRSILCQQ